jgi:hypothetical protein
MLTRSEFGKKLRNHDWYFGYSDDHRVWKRGQEASRVLRTSHEDLDCPWDMNTLQKWSGRMIVEQFAEETPEAWYRQPRKYQNIASASRADLITQAEYDEITQWLALGGTVEELAQYA